MFQFTEEEVASFRTHRDYKKMVAFLIQECKEVLARDLSLIPHEGVSGWSHYYFCPDCSVHLLFEIDKKHSHTCPSCHREFSGEIYDSAWYRLLNDFFTKGAYHLGLLFMLTGEGKYARKAAAILSEYARYYPEYQVHGNIPYNNPGKANAQTLDESSFLKDLAFAYDLVNSEMERDECTYVRERLFREGMEFLIKNRMDQLHNHEVICDGAIGILALLLDDKKALAFALDSKYGLLYQLEEGTLCDGYWFECSTAYHFYALEAFFHYEKFARHTDASNLLEMRYRKMLDIAFNYLREDISFTRINDAKADQGQIAAYDIFEFAYAVFRDERILALLRKVYEMKPRFSIESYFFGVKELPSSPVALEFPSYASDGGLGASVIRGNNHEFLLFRHGPYGGEHDHYDRLGISYNYLDTPVSEDFGTCGYGAPYHYGYFKHTGTHNTVVLDEENQAPSSGKLDFFTQEDGCTDVSASVVWTGDYPMPDSLTIKEWSSVAYEGVSMTRHLFKSPDYLIDIFTVKGVKEGRSIDFVMHFDGDILALPKLEGVEHFSSKKPFSYLENVQKGVVPSLSYANGETRTRYYSMENGHTVYLGKGMSNPTNESCQFFIERAYGSDSLFVHVLSTKKVGQEVLDDVSFIRNGDELCISLSLAGVIEERHFTL